MSATIEAMGYEAYAAEAREAILDGMNWGDYAECLPSDPEIFDPRQPGEDPKDYAYRLRAASTICQACVVLEQCLGETLRGEDFMTFRANMTPKQLKARRLHELEVASSRQVELLAS